MKRFKFLLVVVMILTCIMTFCVGDCEVIAKTTDFATSALKDSELTIDYSKRTFYTVPKDVLNDGEIHDVGLAFFVSCNIKDDKYGSYYAKVWEWALG